MFGTSLNKIIKTFDKVSAQLSAHVEKKAQEHVWLLAEKAEIEDEIKKTAAETDRAQRILSKVQELIA